MKDGKNSVVNGKLTDEQLGKLSRKFREIEKRINEKTLSFDDVVDVLQRIIIEGKSAYHLKVIDGLVAIKTHTSNDYAIKTNFPLAILIPDLGKIKLYLSEEQKNGSWIGKNNLLMELSHKGILGVDILEHLLIHQDLIPVDWRGKKILFWGTLYKKIGYIGDKTYVRCLVWNFEKWVDDYYCVDSDMYYDTPAAVIY